MRGKRIRADPPPEDDTVDEEWMESSSEEEAESDSSNWPETEEESWIEWPTDPVGQDTMLQRLRRRYNECARRWLEVETMRERQFVPPQTLLQVRYEVERARIDLEFFQEFC